MIKASELRATMKRLGKDSPNETRECRYVAAEGEPCCIVGTALIELGVDPEAFLRNEDLNRFTTLEELFREHGDELGLHLDLDEWQLACLYRAQSMQDRGYTWGRAVQELE